MKSPISKLLIPAILLFISLVLSYISSENKGLEFVFNNIAVIISLLIILCFFIILIIKEKSGKISEQQIAKAKNFYSKNDKKRMIIFFICILIASIIYVVFKWYYSIPLFVIAIILYIPILKKIYHGNYGNKTDERKE